MVLLKLTLALEKQFNSIKVFPYLFPRFRNSLRNAYEDYDEERYSFFARGMSTPSGVLALGYESG